MNASMQRQAADFLNQQNRRQNWQRIVLVLAAVVVFVTTYMLILPAITMERTPRCGLEEHQHGGECYETRLLAPQPVLNCSPETLGIHQHTEDCRDEDGNLICGYADFVVHTHDERCYDADGDLICTLPEIEEHVHDESCYEDEQMLVCGLEEEEPHIHEEDCYDADGTLICDLDETEGHIHDDSCYETQRTLVCDMEEVELHTHTEECRGETDEPADGASEEAEGPLICGKPEVLEHQHTDACFITPEGDGEEVQVLVCTLEEHIHTENCWSDAEGGGTDSGGAPASGAQSAPEYVCGLEEHTHGADCYDADGNLICVQEEHTHDDSCLTAAESPVPEYLCGLEEHTHGADCYDADGNLTCVQEEHSHDASCLTAEGPALHELTHTGGDYTVSVAFGDDAALPEGVTLEVREILPDSEEYRTCYDQTVAALADRQAETAEQVLFAWFFDIQFLLDGETVEPAAPVSVTITYDEPVETGEEVNCQSIHFAEEGTELLDAETECPAEGSTSFTHTQSSFSVVGNLVTRAVANAADVGPNSLPVDYYVYIDGAWTCVGATKTGWYAPADAAGWKNTNRDCITVDQAASILGAYGFDPSAANAALQIAYQRKETDKDANLHCDTQSYTDAAKSNAALIPLDRNADPASGYNVYFLPGNTNNNYSSKLETVDVSGSGFYTVSVYDPNHLAYAEGDAIPGTQTIRTGGNAEVTVKALPENSGAVWQCVDDGWGTVAGGTDHGDGTVTFSLTNVTRKLRVTPVADNLGGTVNRTVYFMVFLDGQWQNVGTTTPYYKNPDLLKSGDNYRHFITSSQAESVLAPFGFRSALYSSTVGGTSVLAHQLGKYDLEKEFWTDGGGEQLSDGSWAISLSYVTSGDIDYSVYYLPDNPAAFQGKIPSQYTAGSQEMSGNRFWSVRVVDDTHSVYSDGELSGMVPQYALNGGEVTVTVRNADGVLWSCRGVNGEPVEVESTQAGGNTTFTIKNITQPIEVTATKANPGFTVQYYANIPRFAASGSNSLKVIDTSGKVLPTNGGSMATRNIYLEGIGRNTDQNAGVATELYQVKTITELTRMYADGTFHYEESPGLYYFNKLKDNESYTLKEIWVLKPGKSASSTNRADWEIYTYSADITFTNEAGQAGEKTILINDGAVIRLVSDSSKGDYYNGTTFYDYNISSGQNSDGRWRTGITGINSKENYGTSLNGQRTWNSAADVLAFGNANCGTGMALYQFDGGTLNKYNTKNSNYGGTTFGLAAGLNSDGTIRYNEWIVAPKLFNDGDAIGKQTYADSSLTFDRVGDTYTLSAATLANSNGQQNTLSGLQYFFNPSPYTGKTHTHIYTNNFWPMDPAASRTDALWGAYGNPGKFQGFVEGGNPTDRWSSNAADFPVGDDGRAHNWFFGMNFALSFSLTEDYVGPLEYTFFGDDDLWVFLDNRLICDIGGVHSSVGEYVNLRDYLPNGSSGQHTLSFFYTERGDTGSTCYMSFTLPSVSSATTERDIGQLQIGKTLGGDAAGLGDVEYEFKVELLTGANGSPLNGTYSYERTENGTVAGYGTVKSGGVIKLKNGETALIKGLPAGTYFKVTEVSTEGYKTTVNDAEGYIFKGTIETGEVATGDFVNTPFYELPQTGGMGTYWYTLGGLGLMAAACLLYKKRETQHRKGVSQYPRP